MTILTVDDNPAVLDASAKLIAKTCPEATLLRFDNSPAALAQARMEEIDVAILKSDMPELNGLDLGRYLKELYPYVNLIFLSENPDHGYEAMTLHASGYLLGPLTQNGLKQEMEDLRYPEDRKQH